MVTFLVAVRASTAIAVQVCAAVRASTAKLRRFVPIWESVGFGCVRALEKLPKRDTLLRNAAKEILYLAKSGSASGLLSLLCRRKS